MTEILKRFDEIKNQFEIPTQICVLGHITTQIEAVKRGAPADMIFQSIAGSQKGNEAFGFTSDHIREAMELLRRRGTGTGPNVMYFETGQGSELSSDAHYDADQVTMEARCYAFAREFKPFMVNTVVGFIGPEYLYDSRQVIRAGLEDHFMGKLSGIPMGCGLLLHQPYDGGAERHRESGPPSGGRRSQLHPGGAHQRRCDAQLPDQRLPRRPPAIREILGLRPIREFDLWLEKMGDHGKRTVHQPGRGSHHLPEQKGERLKMLDQRTIDAMAEEIIRRMEAEQRRPAASSAALSDERAGRGPALGRPHREDGAGAAPPPGGQPRPTGAPPPGEMEDIASREQRAIPTLRDPEDYDALIRMKGKTTARIGVGRCGPRLLTKTLLTLRADHALARDAVFTDVDPAFLERNGLFSVQTRCGDKNTHITRPDLGRQLSDEGIKTILEKCKKDVQVQLIVSDGLSSKAIEANVQNALPAIQEGLPPAGHLGGYTILCPVWDGWRWRIRSRSFWKRKWSCILIGERPGLATAESMSAYICYRARVGQPEARRTVVSNIHSGGISAVEAGAYIAELIQKILTAKASGVELQK